MKFTHFNLLIPVLLAIAIVAAAYSIDNQDLDDFFEGQVLGSVDSDEVSYKEFGDFINEWKDYYGYNNTIDDIRAADTKRFKGAAYFDYTGSGVYRESAVRKCPKELENNLFGNAHSRIFYADREQCMPLCAETSVSSEARGHDSSFFS